MPNDYFNHVGEPDRLAKGTKARADAVNSLLDKVETGMDKMPTQAQNNRGSRNYAANTGPANAYAAALSHVTALAAPQEVILQVDAADTNTGACTLNISGLGNVAIRYPDDSVPAAGDIQGMCTFRYNGTYWHYVSTSLASVAAAAASASAAAGSASAASTSATNAGNSASAAAGSASAASTSASAASTSASAASTSASAASTSATNASNSAGAASTSATNAGSSASAAAGSASAASTSATNAGNSATAAAGSASAASTSATNAGNSASAAAGSASAASTSASNAATSAGAASDSADSAASSLTTLLSNPNQASTAQGGTGASDGANTWAKLADFTLTSGNSTASLDFVLLDTFSNAKDHLRFTVTLYADSVYAVGGIVITQNTTPSIIANDGIKLVASSTTLGTSVGIWVNKLTTNKRFELKELAKANVSSITYVTNAAWTATDPTTGPPAFLVSSAAGGAIGVVVDVGSGLVLKTKVLSIGDWNMDTGATKTVPHGLTLADIRGISAIIRHDDGGQVYELEYAGAGGASANDTLVTLVRVTASTFDTAAFDSTSYNRGWITIQYV